MKKQITRTLSLLSLTIVALFSAAFAAQAQTPVNVTADIPFEFRVGDKVLPAGTYRIDRLSRDSSKVLIVRGEEGQSATSGITTNASTTRKQTARPTLVFRHYGEHYFLAQVFAGGDGEGRELAPSRIERAVARDYGYGRNDDRASAKARPELVEITGR